MLRFFKKQAKQNDILEELQEDKCVNFGELIECDDEIMLYKCKISEINNDIFKNWEKNRPPDEIRITQIYQYYLDNNLKIVPGVIYTWEKDNKLYIYDGIHRFLAAQKTNNDMTFLLQIRKTDKESEIINDFLNLNKIFVFQQYT